MHKILSALAAIFILWLCAATIENSTDEKRAGEAKPAINYSEEMRRFVIAISQYGKKIDKNFIVIPQNGLELITEDDSVENEPLSATYEPSLLRTSSRCLTATQATSCKKF